MKLYDYAGAPNPRRVKIFAAEKQLPLELIPTDMATRAHKTPEFLEKNPSGKIPVLELDDGTCIGESVAISRYLEHLAPEPNLFGNPGQEAATVEMYHRQIELEMLVQIGVAWVNGPIVAQMGLVEPIDAARERAEGMVKQFYRRLNQELSSRAYAAGDRFTIADITAVVSIDFAARLVQLKPDDSLQDLWRWHALVSSRASFEANP